MKTTEKTYNFFNPENIYIALFIGSLVFILNQPDLNENLLMLYTTANLFFIYVIKLMESNSRRSWKIFVQSIETLLNYSDRFKEDDTLMLKKIKEKYKEYNENGIDEIDNNFVKGLTDRVFVEKKLEEILPDMSLVAQEASKPDLEADAQRYRQALLKIAKNSSDKYAVDVALTTLRLDVTDL